MRKIYPLNQNWLFNHQFDPAFNALECSEKDFERVILPHTNHLFPISGFDDRDFQFVSSYRRHIQIPETLRDYEIFVDFEGAMAVARIFLNGRFVCEHSGGYTPFAARLTPHVNWGGDNVLAVELDSSERPDTPPFGGQIDYLTFGGLYREVNLRVVNPLFLENVFIKPRQVLKQDPHLEVLGFLQNSQQVKGEATLEFEVTDGERSVLKHKSRFSLDGNSQQTVQMTIEGAGQLTPWDLDHPHLYQASVTLHSEGVEVDRYPVRFGFRECLFTPEGFTLNGKRIQLRGLNRHQTYPWVGGAMPARVQRMDADILRKEFKVNIVRTSHYPQSPHFLDRCDELGLLVFEEIPGWQHIGDRSWQDISCENIREMIRRDWNHPSIILWGTRINESRDNDEFYTRTNSAAKELDDTRQTGGVRYLFDSHLIEDVFTFNDFDPVKLQTPAHPLHLVTEFCGHMYSTKHVDNTERLTEHVRRHAHIQSLAAATRGIAGAIGWCAFDYNTHKDFGSGDRVCHHGVADMFRIPKFAAMVYKAQCPPGEEVVLEPGFHWCLGDKAAAGGVGEAWINSNCDSLKLYLGEDYVGEIFPSKDLFPGLPHPPFKVGKELEGIWGERWKPLRIEGCLQGQPVISRTLSERGVDAVLKIQADSFSLNGDGSDATRVWFMVTDEFGNHRNFALGSIQFEIEGPGEIIGDNPFALTGGCGAVWVRSKIGSGPIHLKATHGWLGTHVVTIDVNNEFHESL